MDDLAGFVAPRGCALGRPLILAAVTGSTNDDARRLAGAGCGHGTVVLADRQTAGRGRLGRTWHAEPGENLSFSIVWREGLRTPSLGTFALAAGLGVAEALDAFVPSPTTVKWPNDVLVDGGKVAGILPESSIGQDARVEHVVLGIGVNVAFAPQLAEMRYPGATLGGTVEAAVEGLSAGLARWLAVWRRRGFETIRAAWLERAGPLGATVDVNLGEELVRGSFAGMDREGALLLETPAGPRRIVSGELLGRAA